MLRNCCGLIIADDHRIHLGELSRPRALSAMPFGGRYRIIDFLLSNMVNSGIHTVGITTYNKYKSLMDHIGTGSAWDLDRKTQGLYLMTPFVSSDSYVGSGSDDLSAILNLYRELTQPYIVIASSNVIMNCNFADLESFHHERKSDITVMYKRDGEKVDQPNVILDMTRLGRIKGVFENPLNPVSNRSSLGVVMMHRDLFVQLLGDAISRGERDVDLAYFLKQYDRYKVYGYEFKGTVLRINSVQNYFHETMRVLGEPEYSDIFWPTRPVFTKVKDEAPAIYSDSCVVEHSMVSDGCRVQGSIQHSMLFRGVTVCGQARLKNCIIFQDSYISEGCELENVIIDKDCVIRPGIKLIGQEAYPMVIGKGAVV